MKFKIKFSALAACVLLLFANCSKSKDFSTSYLRGKIDGIPFDCNANIKANKPEPIPGQGSDPNIRITGEWANYSIKLYISGDGSEITTGIHVFQVGKNRSATIWQNNVDAYYAGNSVSIQTRYIAKNEILNLDISY